MHKTFGKYTQTTDWNYELVSPLHLIWLLYKVCQYLGPGIRGSLVTPLTGGGGLPCSERSARTTVESTTAGVGVAQARPNDIEDFSSISIIVTLNIMIHDIIVILPSPACVANNYIFTFTTTLVRDNIPARNAAHVACMFHAIIIDLHALHDMHVT